MSVLTGWLAGGTAHGAHAAEESVHLAIRPELYSEIELVLLGPEILVFRYDCNRGEVNLEFNVAAPK
jgi:hypothetical protein